MSKHTAGRFAFSWGWLRGEDWWGDPVSTNFLTMDALLHPDVISMTETQPPLANTLGDTYIVPVGAEGDWQGRDNTMAYLSENGWLFLTPRRGVRVRCRNPDDWFWYVGTTDGWKTEDWIPGQEGPPGSHYDLVVWVGFEAMPGDVIGGLCASQVMTLKRNAPNSVGRAVDWPSAPVTLAIKRNNSPIGSIRFEPNRLTAVIDVADDQVIAQGDLVTVSLPLTMPDGFMNYGITLRFQLDV